MVSKRITVPAQEASELEIQLIAVSHSLVRRQIEVVYGPVDDSTTPPTPILEAMTRLVINGEWYDELFSAYPDWSPLKPEGVYRDEDLLDFALDVGPRIKAWNIEEPARRKAEHDAMLEAAAEESEEKRAAKIKANKKKSADRKKARQARAEERAEAQAAARQAAIDKKRAAGLEPPEEGT